MKKRRFQNANPRSALFAAVCCAFLLAAQFAPADEYTRAFNNFMNSRSENERHNRNSYDFLTYFYIDEIERENGTLEIEFNAAVEPSSVSRESFLIDGKPLPENTEFKLSRKGTKIVIAEPDEWRQKKISIEAVNLVSVNGTPVERIPPVFMNPGEEYERDEDLEFVYWYWYDTNDGKAFAP